MSDFEKPTFDTKPVDLKSTAPSVAGTDTLFSESSTLAPTRSFEFHCPSWTNTWFEIRADGASTPTYCCRVPCGMPSRKPGVLLLEGGDKHAPVVAAGAMKMGRCGMKVGLVDGPARPPNDKALAPMEPDSLWRCDYAFEAVLEDGKPHVLAWEHARRGETAVGGKKRIFDAEYRLVDRGTGRRLAGFLMKGGWSWKHPASMRFEGPVSRELELWGLISCCTIMVKYIMTTTTAAAVAPS